MHKILIQNSKAKNYNIQNIKFSYAKSDMILFVIISSDHRWKLSWLFLKVHSNFHCL